MFILVLVRDTDSYRSFMLMKMNGVRTWWQRSTSGHQDENLKRNHHRLPHSQITVIITRKHLLDTDRHCSAACDCREAGRCEQRSDAILSHIKHSMACTLRSSQQLANTGVFSMAVCAGHTLSMVVGPLAGDCNLNGPRFFMVDWRMASLTE